MEDLDILECKKNRKFVMFSAEHFLKTKAILWLLLISFFAVVSGYIASTGEELFVVILSGVFIALLLLANPVKLFFITLITTLIIAGTVLYFIPGFDRIWWVTYGMAALLFIPAVLSFFKEGLKRRHYIANQSMPVSIAVVFFFLVVLFSTIISSPPLFQFIVSMKSFLFFGAIWAFLAFYPISDKVVRACLMILLVIGMLQVFPVLYQYFFVRSERLASTSALVEASDSVVGTFGGSKEGGGLTAVLGFYFVIVLITALSFFKEKLLSKQQVLIILPFLIVPLLLIEVKAIFVFIPIGLFVLYRKEILQNPFKAFLWTVFLLILLGLVLLSYQVFHWNITGKGFIDNLLTSFQYTFEESTSSQRLLTGEISRRQAYEIWWSVHQSGYGVEMLIGHGLGASKSSGITLGEMAQLFAPLKIDMTGAVMVLWDLGVLGFLAVLLVFFVNYKNASTLAKSKKLETWQRALAQALQSIIVLLVVYFFYRPDIPVAAPMMLLLMFVFGLVSWMVRVNTEIKV